MTASPQRRCKNVEACLKVAGAKVSDIIETWSYVADPTSSPNTPTSGSSISAALRPTRTIVKKGPPTDPAGLVEVMAFAAVK
jgi:hypothetical protein